MDLILLSLVLVQIRSCINKEALFNLREPSLCARPGCVHVFEAWGLLLATSAGEKEACERCGKAKAQSYAL